MTASYKLAWMISPFGLFLPICSIILFVISHLLKIKDFKLKIQTKTNQSVDLVNEDNSKLLNPVEQQQSNLHFIKSQ
jgi:hypothetical protein